MTKTEARAELAPVVQEVNERPGTVEYTLQGFARGVVFPWYRRKWKASTAQPGNVSGAKLHSLDSPV